MRSGETTELARPFAANGAASSGERTLTGTWANEMEPYGDAVCITFNGNGTGILDYNFITIAHDVFDYGYDIDPTPFTYSVRKNDLTMSTDSRTDSYWFEVSGDTMLLIDGGKAWELHRR